MGFILILVPVSFLRKLSYVVYLTCSIIIISSSDSTNNLPQHKHTVKQTHKQNKITNTNKNKQPLAKKRNITYLN